MNRKPTHKADIVVALDIGTTKICAIAGRKDEYGRIEILGVGKVESEGVRRGVVSNIDKTVKAITAAVDMCEKQSKYEIQKVYVGIAGQHIRSIQHRGILPRDNHEDEITEQDILRLKNDMYKIGLPPGYKILHVIPQEYTVDNEEGILDPVGMSGNMIEANFHIITGQISASNNILRCAERSGLQVAEMTLEPIASSSAVISDEEIEAGVALVDIGGGTTDITIFHEGIIRHTAVIPFGGDVITKDIKEGCNVMADKAEKLKVRFGSAMAEEIVDNRIITIPGLKGREPKEISEKNLSKIIQARIEEILNRVYWEINRSGYKSKLIGGLVLTGGGSLLKDIDKLASFYTGMDAHIGYPVERLAHGYSEQVSSPIYATAIGLLINGIKKVESLQERKITHLYKNKEDKNDEDLDQHGEKDMPVKNKSNQSTLIDKFVKGMKTIFEPTPDSDLL